MLLGLTLFGEQRSRASNAENQRSGWVGFDAGSLVSDRFRDHILWIGTVHGVAHRSESNRWHGRGRVSFRLNDLTKSQRVKF